MKVETLSCSVLDAVAIPCSLCVLWAFMCFGGMGGRGDG